MGQLFNPPYMTSLDSNGSVGAGDKLYFYTTGTTTPASVYSDSALTTALTNPVVADSAGRFPPIYLGEGVVYRVTHKTAAGAEIKDIDPANTLLSSSSIPSTEADNIAIVDALKFTSDGTGAEARTLLDKVRKDTPVTPEDFGAEGDGVTNDTSAVQAACNVGRPVLLRQTYLCNQITHTTGATIYGPGALKLLSSAGVAAGTGLLDVTTAGCRIEDITIDLNSKGRTGVRLGIAGCVVDGVFVKNFTGEADSAGYDSGIIVNAGDCRIANARFEDMDHGDAVNGSVPRCVTIQNAADSVSVVGVHAKNVTCLFTVGGAATNINIVAPFAAGLSDNGIYALGVTGLKWVGGYLESTEEPLVFSGCTDVSVTGVQIRDPGGSIGLSTCTNVLIDGVVFRSIDGGTPTSFVRCRDGNTTVSNVTVQNCDVDIIQASNGVYSLNIGAVDGFTSKNNRFKIRWTDDSTDKLLSDYDTGSQWHFEGDYYELIDEATTSLTSSDAFLLAISTPTETSFWLDNILHTTSAADMRAGPIIGDNIISRGSNLRGDLGPYQYHTDFVRSAQHVWESTAIPTAGTWSVGDYLRNLTPAEAGTAGSKYVVLGWLCTVAGTPGTWVAVRGLTGN